MKRTILVLTRTECPDCEGSGSVSANEADVKADDAEDVICHECGGTGYEEKWRRIASGSIHVQDRP